MAKKYDDDEQDNFNQDEGQGEREFRDTIPATMFPGEVSAEVQVALHDLHLDVPQARDPGWVHPYLT